MSDSILYEVEDRVAYIRLNRPRAYNSCNREMALAFQEALKKADADENARAVFISGKGKAFCAGQDLKEVMDQDTNPGFKKILDEGYNPIIKLIRNLQKPVVAAVNGVAAGAGANIALACDICIVSEAATFIQAFSKIGLIPDSGGTFFLPRLVGIQKATGLMMLGEKINAQEAERIGLIYKCIPAANFEKEATTLVRRLSQMPTKALWETKQLLNQSFYNTLDEQLNLESKSQIEASKTQDYKEGVQAFIEKRKPRFEGK